MKYNYIRMERVTFNLHDLPLSVDHFFFSVHQTVFIVTARVRNKYVQLIDNFLLSQVQIKFWLIS